MASIITEIPTPLPVSDDDFYWQLDVAASFFGPVEVGGKLYAFGARDESVWALRSVDGGETWGVVAGQSTADRPVWSANQATFIYPKFYHSARDGGTFRFHIFDCATETWSAGPFSPFAPGGRDFERSIVAVPDASKYVLVYGAAKVRYYFNGGAETIIFPGGTGLTYDADAFTTDTVSKDVHLFIREITAPAFNGVLYYVRISYATGIATAPVTLRSLESSPGGTQIDQTAFRAVYDPHTNELILLTGTVYTADPSVGETGVYRGTPPGAPSFTYEAVTTAEQPAELEDIVRDQDGNYADLRVAFSGGESDFGLFPTEIWVWSKAGTWSGELVHDTVANPPDMGATGLGYDGFVSMASVRYPDGRSGYLLGGEAHDGFRFPCDFLGFYVFTGAAGTVIVAAGAQDIVYTPWPVRVVAPPRPPGDVQHAIMHYRKPFHPGH